MKNIHVLPTEKPSRLFKFANELHLDTIPKDYYKKYNIYITSDEEIKEGDWGLSKLNEVILFGRSYNEKFYNKIILTTDQDLISNGIQAIDDEFLEWFVNNPSCEEVEVKSESSRKFGMWKPECYPQIYKIIIPQEESKQKGYICPHTKIQCDDECCVSAEDCHITSSLASGIVDCDEPKQETLEEDNQDTAIRFLEWYRRKNIFFQFHHYHIPNPGDKNWEQTVFRGDNSYLTSRQLFAIFKKEIYE